MAGSMAGLMVADLAVPLVVLWAGMRVAQKVLQKAVSSVDLSAVSSADLSAVLMAELLVAWTEIHLADSMVVEKVVRTVGW
jgi:hypothetical protein